MKGKPVIDKLNEHLKSRAEALRARGAAPALAIVRVGDNGDDMAYERNAAKCCEAGAAQRPPPTKPRRMCSAAPSGIRRELSPALP